MTDKSLSVDAVVEVADVTRFSCDQHGEYQSSALKDVTYVKYAAASDT